MAFASRLSVVFAIVIASGFGIANGAPTIEFRSRELQAGRKFAQQLLSAPGVGESSGQLTYTD